MELTIHVVDAFTDKQFKGNSAAVILLPQWLSDELMQSIALENNLSETAFIVKDSHDVYHIRWFSPLSEIDFCGHATLASAFVIFKEQSVINDINFFAAAVGQVKVTKEADGLIQMSFPNRAPENLSDISPDVLGHIQAGLSITPNKILRNQQAYFAIYDHEHEIHQLHATSVELKKLAPYDVVVTAPANTENNYDFVSRYFWPASGGDEDPVTGSIHTGLAPYWAEKLKKNELVAFQASSRGGILNCVVTDEQVTLSGHAVLYLQGTIYI